MTALEAIVCVDLGKTHCRVTLLLDAERVDQQSAPGLPGLAAPDAASVTAEAIATLVARMPDAARGAAIGVGAAGALTAPTAAAELAQQLASRLRAPAAVASDIVTAHLGAHTGRPGVCLIAGTGAVALGVSRTGAISRRDGLGLTVGDLGSGAWLGRRGVRAAELMQAGVLPAGRLADAIPAARDVASAVAGAPDAAAQLAGRAPAVLQAAADGDRVAADIVAEGVGLLADTALAAAVDTDETDVAALGGLTESPFFTAALRTALSSRGLTLRAPDGTALDGARMLATRHDLLLEGDIHRAHP